MQKNNVKVGSTYIVKVSGTLTKVRITSEHQRGGWYGTNLATGREVRIRTAARLRSEVPLSNPNCDNDKCIVSDGVVRLLPTGSGNIKLCYSCYCREVAWRRERNLTLNAESKFPTPAWLEMNVYE